VNYLNISTEEKVTSILAMPREAKEIKDLSLFMVTKKGTVKKCAADAFSDVRRSGLIAISLHDGDELLACRFVEKKDDVSLVTADGQSIRFSHEDVREMGRTAAGVRGMTIKDGDELVTADVVREVYGDDAYILVISENGYGKMTRVDEYKTQGRAGSGIRTANVTDKTGRVVMGMIIPDLEGELVAISRNAQVIRTPLKDIPVLSRSTQGVRIMKLREGDSIASITVL
jgi:DNA gyrase subunit A